MNDTLIKRIGAAQNVKYKSNRFCFDPFADNRNQAFSLRKIADPQWRKLGLPWQRAYDEGESPLTPGAVVTILLRDLYASRVTVPAIRQSYHWYRRALDLNLME